MFSKSKKSLFFKLFLIIFCVSLALASLSGCSSNSGKTYSKNGISITMSSGFNEKDSDSVTYYLESNDVAFTALKEETAMFTEKGVTVSSLDNYIELILKANKITDSQVTTLSDGKYKLFTYEKNINEKDYFYTEVAVKGTDAYWRCIFACNKNDKNKYESKFINWAQTINVD